MFSKVKSCVLRGIDGTEIVVEADISDGLPTFTMVGYLSSSVKEASERVRTALKNSGFTFPPKRITVNLSPADIKKDGAGFDLPIALAILLSSGLSPEVSLDETLVLGELGLNGDLKPIPGVLPMVFHAAENGIRSCIVPKENVEEAALVKGLSVIGAATLNEAVDYISGALKIKPVQNLCDRLYESPQELKIDFSDIHGQETLKRGMEIAAAGFHNVLMTGAAGAGKSMLAKRLPTIMPRLSVEESIEVTKIYSTLGLLSERGALVTERPFRSPHHTVSSFALVGGGVNPRPGEVSLAHNGVLFLDELPEFGKNALEVLRQPIEDRKVTISRVNASYIFPADFMLVCAMNPCPCGHFPDRKRCRCTPVMIKKYQSRVSGPLLDRIDINMEVKPVKSDDIFAEGNGERSEIIRARVEDARMIQKRRYENDGIFFNSQLEGNLIKKYIRLDPEEEALLKQVFTEKELSARGTHRILKLSRTIADLSGSERIKREHLMEAIFYRNNGLSYEEVI